MFDYEHTSPSEMAQKDTKLNIAVIGGGLVGSLSACFFAKRGHNVNLYEYREDIRTAELVQGRSINLALSVRARTALREIGLEDDIIQQHGIPMQGRMIHRLDGSKYSIPYDAVTNQCIYSVSRKYLNETLLTAAERFPTVHTAFQQKLVSVNLEEGVMTFTRKREGIKEEITEKADLIVGADGAYSTVRKEMLKLPSFDYSQKYIAHGYLELCIPPTSEGGFAMEKNYLHIWPRGSFMMIALPNQDRTWTVTLFMPFENFETLKSPVALLSFFRTHFPDSIPLIGKEKLIKDFFITRPSHLVSVKCNPYHVGSKSIIIGDAAHAMVPFYGQGMNAGFEDCLLLDILMEKYDSNLTNVLPEFSKIRNPDAEAICDLAMYNYIEMRELVNKKSFLLRKKIDNFLYKIFPDNWVPLYNSVTFTTMNYQTCISNRGFQDKVISGGLIMMAASVLIVAYILFYALK